MTVVHHSQLWRNHEGKKRHIFSGEGKNLSIKIIYSPENIGNILNNFAFRIRPTLELTSEGTYTKPEEDLEFSNLYMLVESTSLFQNGKFTQKLKGVINPSFINRARIGV